MLNIFSKKQQYIIGVVLVFSLALLIYSYTRPTPLKTLESLSEIVPGETQKSQLANLASFHSKQENSQENIFFGQNAPQKYSEAIIINNVVVAYKKTDPNIFESQKYSDYISKYGQYDFTVDTSYSEFGYSGYVYLAAGIVIVAHPESQEVIEEWSIPRGANYNLIESLFSTKKSDEIGH